MVYTPFHLPSREVVRHLYSSAPPAQETRATWIPAIVRLPPGHMSYVDLTYHTDQELQLPPIHPYPPCRTAVPFLGPNYSNFK